MRGEILRCGDELELRRGNQAAARAYFEAAISAARNPEERQYYESRIRHAIDRGRDLRLGEAAALQ